MALMQFVLGSASCAFALCAFILWMRRCDGDRSRLTLRFVWMFLALLFFSRADRRASWLLYLALVWRLASR